MIGHKSTTVAVALRGPLRGRLRVTV